MSMLQDNAAHPIVQTRRQPAAGDDAAAHRAWFSALDFEMTLFIRQRLPGVFIQTGTTMMLVSHDLEVAVYLADQVLLLSKRPTRVAEILQ
jgi:ABC-type thiamine transport system ATPase subunit